MMDPWASPQDPVFFLHHAQVDRLWSVWQGLDPGKRIQHVYGTQTAFNRESCSLSTLYDYRIPFPKLTHADICDRHRAAECECDAGD